MRRRSFYRVKRTIVFIARADRHVIETAVRDPCHAHLYRAWGYGVNLHRLTCVLVTLVYHALRRSLLLDDDNALFNACWRLYRLLSAETVSVAGLLKLLRLLQVAELVVRNEKVPSTIWIRSLLKAVCRTHLTLLNWKDISIGYEKWKAYLSFNFAI